MEYVVIGIISVLAIFVIFIMKNPTKISKSIAKNVLSVVVLYVKGREGDIVQAVYNGLPKEVKARVGSQVVADIVASSVNYITEIINEVQEK